MVGNAGLRGGMFGAAVAALLTMPFAALAQTSDTPAPPSSSADRVDPQTKAYLFGAAFAHSDLSQSQAGGMMFLPGRGLIRWETRGKTAAEQEEARIEAIGLADARAVQAEIDAREQAVALETERAAEAMEAHDRALLMADLRVVPGLNLNSITGTNREAGGIAPLNRAAKHQIAEALGVHDGATFKGKSRVYLFGAVSGRGVGLNLLHDSDGRWMNAGLSTDKGGFIGQRQAGIALRSGQTQAALSYVQEKTWAHILGITAVKDHRAMLNITFTPSWGLKPPPSGD